MTSLTRNLTEDPYTRTQASVDRLLKEYFEHGKLIIAVDFDDTVFDYHRQGFTYPGVIDLLRRCQAEDFYLVLFTGTPAEQWPSQLAFFANLDLQIDSVNKNPIPLPFGNDGKPYFNLLLDDRAGLGQACVILDQVLTQITAHHNLIPEGEQTTP